MAEKIFDKLAYVSLMLTIAGQLLIACNQVLIAQICFLVGNIIGVSRCFILKRPLSDKARDIGLLGLTCVCLCLVA